jgi:hypothetical protein
MTINELWDRTGRVVTVDEGEHADIVGEFLDANGDTILKASLSTVQLTLYDRTTLAIINTRNLQSVLDANGGTVDTAGEITMRLNATDNAILDTELEVGEIEEHVARFTWGWNDGVEAREGKEEWLVRVAKLAVPV